MNVSKLTTGTAIWIKQKNKLEYALSRTENEKEMKVAVLKIQKVRNFLSFLFKVDTVEKIIFVEKNEYLLE